jgi:hypothetical protein
VHVVTALDLVLHEGTGGREVWRGPLPPHALERLIADAHLSGVLAGALPNDGAPIRLDACELETHAEAASLRVDIAADGATFRKRFVPGRAFQNDAEVIVARLLASQTLPAGEYRFRCAPPAQAAATGALRTAPLPRRLARLGRRSLWRSGIAAMPRCNHPTILLPRRSAEALVTQARASAHVEVGALLLVEPFLALEIAPCRLGILVREVVPLTSGAVGTATRLRVAPETLAAVPVDEDHGRCRGGLAHSHPFGDTAPPHFLSSEDKAVATAWFWQPYGIQIVTDPRFAEPADALAVYCWIAGELARVCLQLVDLDSEEIACPPSAPPS